MKFKLRNEKGLHCRFCKTSRDKHFKPNLYETKPITGIICGDCKEHLIVYIKQEVLKELRSE